MKYMWINCQQWRIKIADWGWYPRGGKARWIFFLGLQVNQPYDWEGGGGGEGGLETAVYGKRRMRVKNLFIYFLFFFLGGGGGIKETVSIWILELEVVKS